MIPDISITSEDVKDAEKHFGYSFSDDERLSILTCMETSDIRACPGSGKTTLLAAKLFILAKKWPYTHRGICVLSHTNVAREEIEKRVKGTVAEKILSYPHFVGTIQTFVDQFLGIPAAVELFGCRPEVIDDDRYKHEIKRQYNALVKPEWVSNRASLINYIKRREKNETRERQTELRREAIRETLPTLHFIQSGEKFELGFSASNKILKNPTSVSYKAALSLKQYLCDHGYYCYRDMFELAQYYIFKHPQISGYLANRFPMLFIDEMQDTSSIQDTVLENAFVSGEKSIIQRFGDPNQAIYESNQQGVSEISYPRERIQTLKISASKRISPSIAKLAKPLCYKSQDIWGNEEKPNCSHTIYLFDENSIGYIKQQFCSLVKSECDDPAKIVAIGHTGESSNNRSENFPYDLRSYHHTFSKQKKPNRKSQRCFADHLQLAKQEYAKTNSISIIRDRFVAAMLDALKLQSVVTSDGKPYTSTSLFETLKDSPYTNGTKPNLKSYFDCFQACCYWYCGRLTSNNRTDSPVLHLKIILEKIVSNKWNEKANKFWDDDVTDSVISTENANSTVSTSNSNTYFDDDTGLTLELDTIHGVKGKTFSAILLLETFSWEHNLNSLLTFLTGKEAFDIGSRPKKKGQPKWDRNANRLRCAFVAMTRPTDLLCLAMRKDHVSAIARSELKNIGWQIEELEKL